MRLVKSDFGVNMFLGVALGFGYMTSLRFLGPVGISELLVLAVLLYLAAKDPSVFFRFGVGVQALIKSYLFLSFFILMPVVTVFVFVLFDVNASSPLYMISFMMGLLLMFCVINGIKKGLIKVDVVALYFALAFFRQTLFIFYLCRSQQE